MPKSTFERVEEQWLDGLDSDSSDAYRIARAILMLVAEMRDLESALDQLLPTAGRGI